MPFILSDGDDGHASPDLLRPSRAKPPSSTSSIMDNDHAAPVKFPAPTLEISDKILNGAGLVSASSPLSQSPQTLESPNHASADKLQPDKTVPAPNGSLLAPVQPHRLSSPARYSHPPPQSSPLPKAAPPPLQHRHTLEVPRVSTARTSREHNSEDGAGINGTLSPTTTKPRRSSLNFPGRSSRTYNSDQYLDDVPQGEDASRWAEAIRQKRASRRRRKEEEDDDRVVVGTKVDQNHVNYVTAYNMLTGIRFTVSRTNAKIRTGELNDSHFTAAHKFSFDVTGNELTPSAKYDFKFKDYAPEVFRELRSIFRLDPADYLVSLTSKYILSELGSPGKSGSFFYFSRDYKYIIKTIHHGEHILLRKILRDYYNHVKKYPDTLLSQFYGLHRVKLPYGRKIHFVIMNNLFPPHRDIHRTFDLKGSTIGREFKEDDIEANPRATLKDLNWKRRDMHLALGPIKKKSFIEQMQKDVELLKKLKIMDYSLLVGIHDLDKGNEDNLRDKTLQVFQPHGEDTEDPQRSGSLLRSPTVMENTRKVKELRQNLKTQKPVPIGRSSSRMPDELPMAVVDKGRNFTFYADDGGFRATHQDDSPGQEIYYLGIIDCLTKYNFVKKSEHFFKGLTQNEAEISAVPPNRYGARFVNFISGTTVPEEQGEGEKPSAVLSEDTRRDRERTTTTNSEDQVLPVVEEAGEHRRVPQKSREGD